MANFDFGTVWCIIAGVMCVILVIKMFKED